MALSQEYEVRDHSAAVPSDVTVFGNSVANPRPFTAVYVGVAGAVAIRSLKGNVAVFTAPVGVLPIAGTMLMSTGTTATSMVLIFGAP